VRTCAWRFCCESLRIWEAILSISKLLAPICADTADQNKGGIDQKMKAVDVPLYPRGSEWRQWDFHVHTPASFHWTGKRFFQMTSADRIASVDAMIDAMNKAGPAVFVIMDYWTFDGWFALKKRLRMPGAPTLTKTVFPGMELRLNAPADYRLNAHVVFSDKITDQELTNFRTALYVELIGQPLSDECLQRLAREKLGDDLLKVLATSRSKVEANDDEAWMAGAKTAVVSRESYTRAIDTVPEGKAIGFMPWDTTDGLKETDWTTHYSYVINLMKSSPIFESRKPAFQAAFLGIKTQANANWFETFQSAIDHVPRLSVSGSDAHRYADYGVFPGGKATWIKADPTFLGLLQALKEPAKRSYVGDRPPKLLEVDENKTFYIDSVAVQRLPCDTTMGNWLMGCELPINSDLVAIIGNKGSGKSALADVIALLGNSRQKTHFTFLRKDRFRGKSGEPAKHFLGALKWRDGTRKERCLNDDPPPDAVELVRYIPQGHFEELCNEHVSGRSNAFERELRSVIFAHADESVRLGALDFDQLIDQQEASVRDKLGEFRKDLRKLNLEIAGFEDQLNPEIKRSLRELLAQKEKQIEEHKKIVPVEVQKPSEKLTAEQQDASDKLEEIAATLQALEQQANTYTTTGSTLARKTKAVQNVRERIRLLERAYKQFLDDAAKDFEILGLKPESLAVLTVNASPLDSAAAALPLEKATLDAAIVKAIEEKAKLQSDQTKLKARLNAPQLQYQTYLKARQAWVAKLAELTGSAGAPETLEGLKARIGQLDALPEVLADRRKKRLELAGEIFDVLDEQRKARALLFGPVQELIQANTLIRDEYKLQFQATLGGSPDVIADSLFALIKQNSGEFRGGDESFAAVKRLVDQHGLSTRTGVLAFVSELNSRIEAAAGGGLEGIVGIASALRKDKLAGDVYDLLYGLSFLEPRYSLLFQDTHIEQLSPGQRGALLLIFYLLVDKGRNPIILDQPEENLDNETAVSLLVPVLNEAKKRRQIIMVTHNPNLAVVCDAEQVVHSTFDRKADCTIAYESGAIESRASNLHVVNVLEGTKRAFENRRGKYH
jgi:ABC-type lipoprotein export system ATPase subunit